MASRTNWPLEVRVRAVELYTRVGAKAASEQTGVPAGTIKSWASRCDATTERQEQLAAACAANSLRWAERRSVMVEEMGRIAAKALAEVEASVETHDGRNAKDLATAMAILVDKAQLLGGDATSRHEVADARRRMAELRDELAGRRARQAA